jgi:hypothetical protein
MNFFEQQLAHLLYRYRHYPVYPVYLGSMSRDVHSYAHWPRPRNYPPPAVFELVLRGRYWSTKVDDIPLLPPVSLSLGGSIALPVLASREGGGAIFNYSKKYCHLSSFLSHFWGTNNNKSNVSKKRAICCENNRTFYEIAEKLFRDKKSMNASLKIKYAWFFEFPVAA